MVLRGPLKIHGLYKISILAPGEIQVLTDFIVSELRRGKHILPTLHSNILNLELSWTCLLSLLSVFVRVGREQWKDSGILVVAAVFCLVGLVF